MSALVQKVACYQKGDKPLSDPVMIQLIIRGPSELNYAVYDKRI